MAVAFAERSEKKKFSLPKCLSFLKNRDSDFYYYLFMVVMGVLFFAVCLFTQYFTTPLGGDYNSQQFSFYTNGYDDWWRFFRTGQFTLYDTNTFLGASNIGSNSFYYLFDPFFLPILLFPRVAIPQGMAILTIFKMALAGLLFSRYLRYMGISKKTSRITGLAYGFSGWIAWYLWFNHFTGVAVIFPVILLGVEKVLNEKKPWLLMLSLAILGFCNFFFFFTFIVAAFLYAMFRFFQGLLKHTVKENFKLLGIGFIGFFAGALMGMMIILPAMMVALNAPRAQNSTYLTTLLDALKARDFGTFFYNVFSWKSQNVEYKTFYPIINFIFPTMTNRGTPLTKLGNESYDNVAGSIFCYYPYILFFIPALISSTRRKHFSALIGTALMLVMIFTPFVYYAFHGFTYAYARWNLFLVTSLMTYVSFYIDRIKEEPKWYTFIGTAFSIIMVWVAVQCAVVMVAHYSNFTFRYSYTETFGEKGFVIMEGALATLYIIILSFVAFLTCDKRAFDKVLMGFISAELVVMGALTLEGHGYSNYPDVNNGYQNNVVFQELIERIKKDDPTYYRCYSSQENSSARNDGMRHDYNGLGMFHSVYNFNDYGFLNWSQINDYSAPGSYSASYVEKRQNLDTFLGVKYYFVHKNSAFWGDSKAVAKKYQYYRANVPLGFTDITDQYPNSTYLVYRNDNYIDLGFAFDNVYTYEMNEDDNGKKTIPTTLLGSTILNEELYIKGAIMSTDDIPLLNGMINESHIAPANEQQSDSDLSYLSSKHYTTTYYDIHSDAESDRQDCSSAYFVSNLLDLSAYKSQTTKPGVSLFNGRYVTVLEAKEQFPYDEKGMAFYLKNSYVSANKINVYFVTEVKNENDEVEQKFLLFDNHNDSAFSINDSGRKNWRGYYVSSSTDSNGNFVPAPKVTKIIICARFKSVYSYQLYYQSGTSFFNRIDTLKQSPLTDVNYRENHWDFKTNFDEQKVIVTRLPYEKGFTVKATLKDGSKKDIEVFTAQGGFVSFLAEKGDTYYSLDFYPPYLKEGSYLSILGLFIFASTLLGYIYVHMYRNYKNNKESFGYSREPITFIGELKKEVKNLKIHAK